MMKPWIITFFLFISVTASAQDVVVPQNYKFKSADDFKRYQPDVINCINWLAVTPRNQKKEKRREAEDFIVSWIYKCPFVKVVMDQYVMKVSSKNPDLVLSFIFGYTKYSLEHPEENSLLVLNVAGVNHMLDDYLKNRELLEKDSDLDDLVELRTIQRLDAWIKPQLTRSKI